MIHLILIGILSIMIILVLFGPKVHIAKDPTEPTCPAAQEKKVIKEKPTVTDLKDLGFNPVSGYRLAVKPGLGNQAIVTTQKIPVEMPITFKSPNSNLPVFNDGAVSMEPYAHIEDVTSLTSQENK